jgi:hypothetical protein
MDLNKNLVKDRSGLLVSAVLQDSLDNPATIGMDTKLYHMICDRLYYEVQ